MWLLSRCFMPDLGHSGAANFHRPCGLPSKWLIGLWFQATSKRPQSFAVVLPSSSLTLADTRKWSPSLLLDLVGRQEGNLPGSSCGGRTAVFFPPLPAGCSMVGVALSCLFSQKALGQYIDTLLDLCHGLCSDSRCLANQATCGEGRYDCEPTYLGDDEGDLTIWREIVEAT